SYGVMSLHNSIVAGNRCCGTDLSGSYTGDHNLIGGNPRLGPLADNGGHTQTHALMPGSPAIDAGDNTGAPEGDQRGPGFPRVVNGTIDMGSYEVQGTAGPGALVTDRLTALVQAAVQEPTPVKFAHSAVPETAPAADTPMPVRQLAVSAVHAGHVQ